MIWGKENSFSPLRIEPQPVQPQFRIIIIIIIEMSDMMIRHEEIVFLLERSEILCYLLHKCTSYKYATTIHSGRVSCQRETLRKQPYPISHIYIYISCSAAAQRGPWPPHP